MNIRFSLLFCLFLMAGCAYNPDYIDVRELSVRFIKPTDWDGKRIPLTQICQAEGGRGSTPPLYVDNIPPETNVIILEINNTSNVALSTDGGQGSVGFYHDGSESATLIPVPGEAYILPSFAFEERASRVNPARPFAYMPPCFPRKNKYSATVKAVKRTGSFDKQKTVVLGEGLIELGVY